MDAYIMFHTDYGWLTDGATYTSDFNEAKRVDYDTALQYCRRYCQQDGYGEVTLKLVMLRYTDAQRIVEK